MSSKTYIHLLRHGEVENPNRVIYERLPDFHLSKLGFKMADRVRDYIVSDCELRNISHIVSSPLERTQETARPTAAALDLRLTLDERLIESGHSLAGKNGFKGAVSLLKKFKLVQFLKLFKNPFRPSWGESYLSISERMVAAIEDAKQKYRGEQTLIVSHQNPIWVARRTFEGRTLWHNPKKRVCQLASITTLVFNDDADALEQVIYHTPCRDLQPIS